MLMWGDGFYIHVLQKKPKFMWKKEKEREKREEREGSREKRWVCEG